MNKEVEEIHIRDSQSTTIYWIGDDLEDGYESGYIETDNKELSEASKQPYFLNNVLKRPTHYTNFTTDYPRIGFEDKGAIGKRAVKTLVEATITKEDVIIHKNTKRIKEIAQSVIDEIFNQ